MLDLNGRRFFYVSFFNIQPYCNNNKKFANFTLKNLQISFTITSERNVKNVQEVRIFFDH
jgi:hypothetical protein